MAAKRQLDLLLELHELEQSLKNKKDPAKKTLRRIEELIKGIDPWVLKHYRRMKMPFGEFRERTCWGCGMIYPESHVHCRPSRGEVRLCESCGKILLLIDEEQKGENGSQSIRGRGVS